MKIYPYLSYHREVNETDVNYACSWQKVWYSSDSLNGNGCSLLIFIRSILQFQWSAEIFFSTVECDHRENGEGKGQFWGNSYFWIEVFLRDGTLEKLWWGSGGGRSFQKKIFAQGKIKWKKIQARQLKLKKYWCYGLKKIHIRNLITTKNSCGSKILLPPP